MGKMIDFISEAYIAIGEGSEHSLNEIMDDSKNTHR
jgi:hypothetical protein